MKCFDVIRDEYMNCQIEIDMGDIKSTIVSQLSPACVRSLFSLTIFDIFEYGFFDK